MRDEIVSCVESSAGSVEYAEPQGGLLTDDPLAAIQALRLKQLAVCRLKSAQDMQLLQDELQQGMAAGCLAEQ